MRTLITARGLSLLRARTSSFTTTTHKLKIETLNCMGSKRFSVP
jgi:hypothetical protein